MLQSIDNVPIGVLPDVVIQSEYETNLSNTMYIYHDANATFQSWNGSTGNISAGRISAFQSFFIQASGGVGGISIEDGAIINTTTNNSTDLLKTVQNTKALKLSAEAGDIQTDAWLSFQEGGEEGKDRFDGLSLQPFASTYLQVGTLDGDELLQINAQSSQPDSRMVFPLIIQGRGIADKGTLSFEGLEDFEGWEISIQDTKTGDEISVEEGSTIELDVASINTKDVPALVLPTPTIVKAKASSARYRLMLQPGVSVSTEDPGSTLPTEVSLGQNFPNPFNPTTTINFLVPKQGNVRLEVFDLLGRKVSELLNEPTSPGRYSIKFDASHLASGIYIYRLQVGNEVHSKKMTLIK